MTVAGCYFDEVAIQAESFVNQATLRALTYPNRKYWFNCNPKGPYHWFKKQWIDDLGRQNAIRIKFNMHDNPILSDEDIENIKGRYQGMFRKRYIDGDWVMAEGLVYSNFNKKTMIHDYPPISEITNYYVSCDFGAQNPTAFLLWGNYNNTWPCLKQYYYDGRHEQHDKSITEYANDLDTFLGDLARKTPIILDPSAKAFAIELEQRGYTVIPANNDVLDGIREVQNAMNNGLIWYTPNLPDFFREKTSYAWNTKLAEKGIDKVIKKHDHLQDAERYFVMFLVTVLLDRQDEDGGIQFGMR
ncbi:PBSX family phage terminase large subunit [Apilactobacillus micheneri]|uniref:PBSX family phage terminase large subunit n=1 Tax=Apilactobacillus micheneri TaxID=1899430 RepID=UPI00112B0889|nr:PBSX family phage terminase large subunit [Apilactobacillus micheneri]TPR43165.1 PBSX family phage terminase large subunit [Apilactobacillus micheneri]TPR47253.1 PBSX family phage terminase large subunit [Apilactobacillus micheneri]